MPRRPADGRAAAIVFALLVLATLAAFAYAQRVKRDPLVLDRATFATCRDGVVRIRFRTTISDQGTVQIVKPGGRVVLTLARDEFLKRYTFHTFYWDGRQRDDGIAPPGRYKLRVKLLGEGRVLVTPGVIRLHPPSKRMKSLCATPGGSGGLKPGSAP
jgi:hypothetical protein